MTDKRKPLVTIAIPTYNRANAYLRQALESTMRQTYENIEIVVSDNCSSDNTEDFVKNIGDSRIRYFRQKENIGANNNFNFCIDQANGDYFQLLQDDDMIDEDFIETCIKAVNYEIIKGIIQTGTRIIDGNGDTIYEAPNKMIDTSAVDYFLGWFSFKTAPYLCSTLFNTEVLRKIGGFNSRHNLFQDVLAEAVLTVKYGRKGIYDVKASFRKHPNEMTFAVKVKDWCEDSLMLMDLICDLIPEKRKILRSKGLPFFAFINYKRAQAVKSAGDRLKAYVTVFTMFKCRYFPSMSHFYSYIYDYYYNTPIYNFSRFIKRKIKQFLPIS